MVFIHFDRRDYVIEEQGVFMRFTIFEKATTNPTAFEYI